MGRKKTGGNPKAEPAKKQVEMPQIDRLVHEPARLLILMTLAVVEHADFLFVMGQTGLTFGNMSSHTSKLEEAGYVAVEKQFVGKKPNTILQLTDAGRTALEAYQLQMRAILGSNVQQ